MRVLVLNPGSSTLKASLVTSDAEAVVGDTVDWPAGEDDAAPGIVRAALDRLPGEADAIGYRVVHGGTRQAATLVDDDVLDDIERLDALAPLHNRRAAATIRAGLAARPDVPHVACFDTAFHAGLPEAAWRYPVPRAWVERYGIRRFGFHGLSVAWATRRTAELLSRSPTDLRLVVAHLGSGCSVTAVQGGRSVDTSMGYTPYEGLMMGTRSGSVDPGIILDLLRRGLSRGEVAEGLGHESGLLAVAGTAGAREVEARAGDGDPEAALALEMFARRAAAGIAAAATTLSALDAVVFTGGIGEGSAAIRGDIVGRLGGIGLPSVMADADGDTVVASGPPAVVVVLAREDLVIGAEVAALLAT
jgi:acetate kinase